MASCRSKSTQYRLARRGRYTAHQESTVQRTVRDGACLLEGRVSEPNRFVQGQTSFFGSVKASERFGVRVPYGFVRQCGRRSRGILRTGRQEAVCARQR